MHVILRSLRNFHSDQNFYKSIINIINYSGWNQDGEHGRTLTDENNLLMLVCQWKIHGDLIPLILNVSVKT